MGSCHCNAMLSCFWLCSLTFIILRAVAEQFIIKTAYGDRNADDSTCSQQWTRQEVEGVQDVCQLLGNGENRGYSSPTGKVYVLRTCNATHLKTAWFSDAACSQPLELPSPREDSLQCSADPIMSM